MPDRDPWETGLSGQSVDVIICFNLSFTRHWAVVVTLNYCTCVMMDPLCGVLVLHFNCHKFHDMPVKLERLKSVTFCHLSENLLSFRIIKSKRKLRVVSEMTDILG